MKVKKFAVSVQWGQGFHHFLRADYETQLQAELHASQYIERHEYKHKKGNIPTVHLWRHYAHTTCAAKAKDDKPQTP